MLPALRPVEANAVVHDDEAHSSVRGSHGQAHPAGLGVARDVVESFLRDPEKAERGVRGELVGKIAGVELRVDALGPG
jgi:hypothetical protein